MIIRCPWISAFKEGVVDARRTEVEDGDRGVDRTEQMHVKVVLAVARRHQVSKVFVRGFLALAAEPQIDYLGIELLRAKHEAEAFPRFKNLLGGAQCRNLKGKEVSSTLELPGK